ncbi:MAG: TIGR01777 family protein [Acidobacteria bacterium]|nr:TIGR01777 family protein [Acidobacteriota bacterium]
MRITLTGATGFIGRHLIARLLRDGHALHVLGRHRGSDLAEGVGFSSWDALSGPPPEAAIAGAGAVIHLAGEPVAQRWNEEVKRRIRESRTKGTLHLVQALSTAAPRPGVLVSASGIGYYGDGGEQVLTEDRPPGQDFAGGLAVEWEKQANLAASLGMRVVTPRIGFVLGRDGGGLKTMLTPFKLGLGGRLGSGRQWMSWIHVEDLADLLAFAAVHDGLRGPVNAVAPNPVRNAEFTRELASVLRRPAIFPVPPFLLKLMFGEGASLALCSQRAEPRAAQKAGFHVRFPELRGALEDLLGR